MAVLQELYCFAKVCFSLTTVSLLGSERAGAWEEGEGEPGQGGGRVEVKRNGNSTGDARETG